MSEGLNKVYLLGNLVADPELRMVSGGQAVMKMRLATSESYVDRTSNDRKERTEYHSVVLWGKRAESLSKFLAKGARIHVEGALRTSSWETDGGEKRYRTEIVASNVLFANARGENERTADRSGPPRAPGRAGGGRDDSPAPAPQEDFGSYGGTDDDIPFIVNETLRDRWNRP